MAERFGFEEEADADAFGFEEEGPAEIASPPKDKAIPRSALGATLKAFGELPGQAMAGWALEQLGATAAPVRRAGAPEVGAGETFLNKAANMAPGGPVVTDLGVAGGLLGAKKVGEIAPDTARALSGLSGRLLPEWLQLSPVPGPGAKLTPQAVKELASLGADAREPEGPGAVETYRRVRDVRRARTEAGEEQNPLAALAGSGTMLGLQLLAPLPKFTPKGGQAATAGAKIAAGAKTGAAYGGLAGLTSGGADTAGGDFAGTATEGLAGLLGGGLLGGVVPGGAVALKSLTSGVVKPTPAARALQEEGVEGLTLGQMDPKSTIGVLEGANQSVPGFGPALAGAREAAKDSFRVAALNKALPPGMEKLPQGTPVAEGLGKIQEGFDKAYGAVRDATIPTYRLGGVLGRVTDPAAKIEAGATSKDVKRAADFVRTQLSRIPEGDEVVPGSIVLEIRKSLNRAIREEARKQSPNLPYARILQAADDELSEGLESALPKELAATLRAADAKYGTYKVLEDAAFKAKDSATGKGEFTPERLGISVRDAARTGGRADYVSGGGGPLRELEANAIQSFQEIPPTGLRSLLAGGLLGRYVGAPAIYLANQPGVQPYMLGEAPAQQRLRPVQEAIARYLSRLNTGPQTLAPQAVFEALRNAPQENP